MANTDNDVQDDSRRRSRKEILRERKRQRQTREVRIAVAIVVALVLLVLVVAVVNEYVIRPRQPVAEVGNETITLSNWQDRVRFQRAQFIIALEDQLEAFQDVSLVQQFSGQQINLLAQPELMGELVLEQMIDEVLVRQEAEERDITVTDEEVEERIGEQFNYFGGALPTPLPTPTETIMPTPSLTPIPTEVITEVVPTNTPFPTPTQGPTGTPRPTATAVSEEAFQEEFGSLMERYQEMGVSEGTYREVIRASVYREKLAEALAEEQGLSEEAEHASVYAMAFQESQTAEEALAAVEEEGYLTVWNRIRSTAPGSEEAAFPNGQATELLWRTQDQVAQQFGVEVAEAAFELDLDTPSDVIESVQTDQSGVVTGTRHYLIMVSGREVRELSQSEIRSREQELVSQLIEERREVVPIERFPLWRARVPTQPILDPIFLTQPTPQAPQATPLPQATPGG